jgi:hypothetical protein
VQSPYRETGECQHVAGGAREGAPVSEAKQNVAALDLNKTVLPLAVVEGQLTATGDENDADLKRMVRGLLQEVEAVRSGLMHHGSNRS